MPVSVNEIFSFTPLESVIKMCGLPLNSVATGTIVATQESPFNPCSEMVCRPPLVQIKMLLSIVVGYGVRGAWVRG